MTNLEINVKIGLTPELADLLSKVIDSKAVTSFKEQKEVEPEQKPTELEQKEPEQEQKPVIRSRKKEVEPVREETAIEPETEPEPETETAPAATNDELTEEDVRNAMHRTRERIEGDDYKDNPESDAYKKYHKQLTAAFKRIAAELGSDKPSALPVDKRASFIAQVDQLVIENGLVTTKLPF